MAHKLGFTEGSDAPAQRLCGLDSGRCGSPGSNNETTDDTTTGPPYSPASNALPYKGSNPQLPITSYDTQWTIDALVVSIGGCNVERPAVVVTAMPGMKKGVIIAPTSVLNEVEAHINSCFGETVSPRAL
jgi:hypothetical protein